MTRATFIALLVMGVAIVALGYVVVDQGNRLDREFGEDQILASGSTQPAPRRDSSVVRLEQRIETVEGLQEQMRRETRDRFAAIETMMGAEPPVEPMVEGESPAVAYPVSPAIEEQVTAILDRREEERQKADLERRAERMAGFFLRDIQTTPEQRKQFTDIVAAFWDERGKLLRQEYPSQEARQAATEGLAADRDMKLQQIFDAAQFAQVSERLDRMNRGGGGGGGGGGRGGNNRTGGNRTGGDRGR